MKFLFGNLLLKTISTLVPRVQELELCGICDSLRGIEESSIRNWEDKAPNNPIIIASIEQNCHLTGRISLGQGFERTGYSWCHLVPCEKKEMALSTRDKESTNI